MRVIGGLLFVLGMVGLLLNLILWLPTGFNTIIVMLICIVCLMAIWGGGSLSKTKTELVMEPARQYEPAPQQPQLGQQSVACPKCGCWVAPGQQFCGGCGSSLESYCARCGAAITAPSRFCGSCGAQLS
ncbi:MAG: zinc ribbon domain-containing protein [Chloroflexota bacterium]|nr:MAG: zinc ribbon domain-containing protein [Chloroflexota bacterium]